MLDLVIKAVAYSSCIGIGAAAIALIYNTTKTFNFAHSSMVTWGIYMVFTATYLLGKSPYFFVALSALFGAFLGIIVYVSVNRRLIKAKANEVTLMMSTLGVDLILFGFLNIYSDYLLSKYKFPAKYFALETRDVFIKIGDAQIRLVGLVAPIVLALIVIFLHTFLTKTKIGTAMRASVENPELAGLSGINPEVVYLLAWVIGGALAGLSGGLLSMVITGYTAVGMTIVVSFFAGAIVGGLYSVYGSLLGGFLIGLGEYLGVTLLSRFVGAWIFSYRPAIPLVIMAITLLVEPRGLVALSTRFQRR
jgi:branched-chain amino acid transport system permease protein